MDLRVILVEDDTRYRMTLGQLLESTAGFALAGSFSSAEQALLWIAEQAPERPGFDIVLMDIELPRASGIEATAKVRALIPDAIVVMLTVFEEPGTVLQAICAGANGYLLK